jgi:DNA-binding GntR family transcriptional regulator
LRNDIATQDVREIIAVYELLNQEIMDKEASLGEKLDEQARYDSLG